MLYESDREKYGIPLAYAYNSLGAVCAVKGENERAEEYFKDSLRSFEKSSVIGNDKYSEQIAVLCNNLGVICRKQGRTDESRAYHRKAISKYEDLVHTLQDRYCSGMAMSCWLSGKIEKDRRLLDRAYGYACYYSHDNPDSVTIIKEYKKMFDL